MRHPILVASLLAGLSLFLSSTSSAQHEPAVEAVLQKIEKAKTCISKTDCVIVKAEKCPYGCNVLVHRRQAKAIEKALSTAKEICQLKCPGPEYYKTQEVVCENRVCQYIDPKSRIKATAEDIKNTQAQQRVLQRIMAIRDHVSKYKGHSRILRIKLQPIERRMAARQNPTKFDYATLTQLEQRYRVLESAASNKKKK
jgi:hypothetical protein